jgi:hypothetical protein
VDCVYNGQTCINRSCNCANPNYNPADPICTDTDCTDICTLRCQEERCVEDSSCEEDIDCIQFGQPFCLDAVCVECMADEDCNETLGETCIENRCDTPCLQDAECPLFQRCDIDTGECIEFGCTTDRECVLAASRGNIPSGEDARLARCLPSDEDAAIYACKIPCENDGSCAQFEICEQGFCRFIGCDNDEECRAYLGLQNIDPEILGFTPRAVCRQ